jgi:cysteine desulfurase
MSIYLDHSATTPIDKNVLKEMLPYFNKNFGNSSSVHSFGQKALLAVDQARQNIADFLKCDANEIIFTSGATESNNLALRGLIKNLKSSKIHLITSQIEHDSILETCQDLEKEKINITYLPVEKNGQINLSDLKKAIKPETVLISIIYVNSEVGIKQPIKEIGKLIKKINKQRDIEWQKLSVGKRGERPNPIYFHVDATQAINFFNCDIRANYIDLLSLSGHKIYGPKGVGLLYKKKEIPFQAIQTGGHQENNYRSGTLNVPGIVGLGCAIKNIKLDQEKNNNYISDLRNFLVQGLQKNIPDIILNTDLENSSPSHAHFSFLGAEGESILISLDLKNIAVSTGSACASHSLKSSSTLMAMGIDQEITHSSIRFTLGKYNTKIEIEKVIKTLPNIIKRIRKINPLYVN